MNYSFTLYKLASVRFPLNEHVCVCVRIYLLVEQSCKISRWHVQETCTKKLARDQNCAV